MQQIYEAGPAFEQLIDHPAWIAKVTHFISTDTAFFDALHGPRFIDENFANLRSAGEAIGLHSGGQDRVTRCQFRYHDNKFHCGQINILIGLNRIGSGDGATMVIPGSHKSNICHPELQRAAISTTPTSVDYVTGAVEVFLEPGDAILFWCHHTGFGKTNQRRAMQNCRVSLRELLATAYQKEHRSEWEQQTAFDEEARDALGLSLRAAYDKWRDESVLLFT